MRRKDLLGLLFLLPAVAQAQNPANNVYVAVSGASVCTNGTFPQILGVGGSVATSCVSTDGRVGLSGSSSNYNGVLRSGTAMSVAGGPIAAQVRVGSAAAWGDVMRYTAAPGTAVVSRVELHYLFSGILESDGITATSSFQGYSAGGGIFTSKSSVSPGGPFIPFQSFADDLVWGVNVSNGNLFFDIVLATDLQGGPKAQAISGYSDFTHTVGLTQIAFFDANNNDVSADVTYSFDNGTQFLPTSVVPEPGTWAMMLSGLVCVGFMTKRRARQ